jgi:hypothetical protein
MYTAHHGLDHAQARLAVPHLDVVVQVEFESKGLKPVSHFIGSRGLNPGVFKLWAS